MASVAIVYHSGYGHTKKLAESVLKGVQSVAGVSAKLINIDDFKGNYVFDDLNSADAIIFGCPTYMGGPSGQFKTFIDAASKVWFTMAWKDKLAAGFTNSGSLSGDKLGTISALWINAMQHGMVWVGTALMPAMTDNPNGAQGDEINRLGGFGGLMSSSSHKAPLDATPPAGDLKTGELFGARIAETTLRWVKGKAS